MGKHKMIKKIVLFSFIAMIISGGNIDAAKLADLKKMETFLKEKNRCEPLDLSDADMRKYDLTTPGSKEMFTGTNMKRANFACQKIRGITFEDVDLEGANFANADLSKVSFWNCNLSNANFKGAKLRFGGFRNTNLSNTNFTGAHFESIGFDNLKMSGAIFDNADFFRVSLVNVDYQEASFKDITKRDCSGFPWF